LRARIGPKNALSVEAGFLCLLKGPLYAGPEDALLQIEPSESEAVGLMRKYEKLSQKLPGDRHAKTKHLRFFRRDGLFFVLLADVIAVAQARG